MIFEGREERVTVPGVDTHVDLRSLDIWRLAFHCPVCVLRQLEDLCTIDLPYATTLADPRECRGRHRLR